MKCKEQLIYMLKKYFKVIKIIMILIIIIISILIYKDINTNTIQIKRNINLGENIYEIEKNIIYDTEYQREVEATINEKFTNNNSINNPLLIYNAYGTNLLSINIYYYTEKPTKAKYTIVAEGTQDFCKNLYTANEFNKKHEYQLIGLVEGVANTVIIESIDEDGNEERFEFNIQVPNYEQPTVEIIDAENSFQIEEGLYVLLGTLKDDNVTVDDTFLVDEHGTIRGIIPLPNKTSIMNNNAANDTSDDLVVYNEELYFNITNDSIAKVNRLGQVVEIYKTDGYTKHHDFKLINNKLFLLANEDNANTVEDIILIYNLEKRQIEKKIDLKELLSDLRNRYSPDVSDWIHVNSIDVKENEMIISSRELSAIICIDDIYNNPNVKYILGIKEIFRGTDLEDKVLNKEGDFFDHLGQHTAFYADGNTIGLYDNNFGKSAAVTWINWENYENAKDCSYFYLYEIDESNHKYNLINKVEVPLSPYMSGSQYFGNNLIISSRRSHFLGEYRKTGEKIIEFNINRYVYRVRKYSYNGFWFEEQNK